MINIGEGSLAVPAGWHNASVNIFSMSAEGGLSVSISRDKLGPGISLTAYVEQQLASLPQQLARFSVLQQGQIARDGLPFYWFDITWHSPQQGLIHQILMCAANGDTVLNFSGTQTGMMTDAQRRDMMAMLGSFSFHANGSPALNRQA